MSKWNETYETRIVKYTINLPIPMYKAALEKARRIDPNLPLSVYVRKVIERDLRGAVPETMTQAIRQDRLDEYIEENPVKKVVLETINLGDQKKYVDPPRRFHGFNFGLRRSSFKLRWFRTKAEDRKLALDKRQSAQYNLF